MTPLHPAPCRRSKPTVVLALLTAGLVAAGLLAAGKPARADTPPSAGRLLCLGTAPGFMFTATQDEVTFDYLGDGQYTLDPPLSGPPDGFGQHTLVTARERWPVYIERRACTVARATLEHVIEISVPTSAGRRPLKGCCLWKPAPSDAGKP